MPRQFISEAEMDRIFARYIKNVRRDPATVPNITEIVTEALKSAGPKRAIEPSDVTRVLLKLAKRTTISDAIIQEAAKEVSDQSAQDDLEFMIHRHIVALGKKPQPDDIEKIIQFGKLDPYQSSLQQIRTAVQNYFATGKRLEDHTPAEIRDLIRGELAKHGPVRDEDVQTVIRQYMTVADPELPFDPEKVQKIIRDIIQSGGGPSPTPIVQPGKPKEPPTSKIKPGSYVPPENPKKLTFFEAVRKKLQRYGIKSLSRGARNWLTDHVEKAARPVSRKKLLSEGRVTPAHALIGKMFMYFYDAKTKKTLPYWDKFPLIFVIELKQDGWLGLNLHYLDQRLRVRLFDKLLQFADDRSLDNITRLKLSYTFLRNFTRFPEVKPCIKRYLTKHIRSDMITVQPVDWEIALFLPVEQFQKETKETVWKKSKSIIQAVRKTH